VVEEALDAVMISLSTVAAAAGTAAANWPVTRRDTPVNVGRILALSRIS
jgi:hypothetical protein